jgi:peptidoglycan/LPS O-acetylase OafA/YrhL
MNRVRALDGLRAVAVVAVVAFHLNERGFPGGFLGVDVFFVLSGFLITTLLVVEWDDRGAIAVARFWQRRARRVIPLLVLTLVVVALVTPVLFDDVAGRVRGELVAALAQGSNWFEAVAGRSYFDTIGRPSPLRHLWSLGVEAQFYLAWPVVAAVSLRHGGRRRLGIVAAGLAAASFLAMAVLFHPGHDPSRLYYGTDTRLGTILVGAALAVGWRRVRIGSQTADLLATVAGVGLLALVLRLDGASAFAYRGGLLLAACFAAVLVAASTVPGSWTSAVLSLRPMVWLGTRSYAVYLWHWPVITATRAGTDVDVHGWALLALRLSLTLALAEVSTRAVDGAVRGAWPKLPAVRQRVALAAAAVVLVAAVVTVQPAAQTQPVFYVSPTTTLPSTTTTTALPAPVVTVAVTASVPATTVPVTQPPPPPTNLPAVPPDMPMASADVHAVAVGESVLMAAGGDVQRAIGPGTVVDADVARQPDDVLSRLAARRAAGYLDHAAVVVIQMGTNGEVDMHRLERMAELVVGVPRVVAVTIHVDRPWAAPGNKALRDAAQRWPWLRLAEWDVAASQHPEWLGSDGVHPNREGARQYAALVQSAATAA